MDREIARTRSELIDALAAALARMRAAANAAEWQQAVLEAGRQFADDAAALQMIASLAALTAPGAPQEPPAPTRAEPGSNSAGQRFARVKIAEMHLYHADAVKSGRASRDLYGSLKPQIDDARAAFRAQFLSNGNGTADHLHAEIVHALANDDATLLGPEYPGPLA